jgi:hypothetical protein
MVTKATEATENFDDLDEGVDDIALATGSSFPRMEDIEGCLLLMKPYDEGTRPSKNNDGKTYVWVECDVVVLQAPGEGSEPLPTDFFEGESLPFELEGFQFTGDQVTSFLKQKMKRSWSRACRASAGATPRGSSKPPPRRRCSSPRTTPVRRRPRPRLRTPGSDVPAVTA